jgi:hypothetical protein
LARYFSTVAKQLFVVLEDVETVEQQVRRVDGEFVVHVMVDDVREELDGLVEVVVVVEDARLAVLDLHKLRRIGHVLDVGVEGADHLLLVLGDVRGFRSFSLPCPCRPSRRDRRC